MSTTGQSVGQSVGRLFWAAANNEPLPVTQAESKSSCCGPRTAAPKTGAADAAAAGTGAAETGAVHVEKASCCGPKPKAGEETTPAVKSSCCG
ncbi:hypothetical protein [Sphaerimonospora thailandensis]|uniref:Uncharacterized protein n=1 Tax=Sphaerimonospora thailandensis TaxID=795644 RepID=A0A8J3W115_9ACTN|nr:hypothetical protein [Sphaerimonospora thailandensis]GIH72212.1 hypothetical protein Mth01_44650 [Sphaerimonospora thailandensis]